MYNGQNLGTGKDGLQGVYWQGQNGNIYVQGNNGQVLDAGKSLGTYANGFDSANTSSQSFRQIADPNVPINTGAPQQSAAANTGASYGSGSSYSTPDYSALTNAYNAQFDNAVGSLDRQKDLAGQISQSGQNQVNQSYGIQSAGLAQQRAQGNANLDLSQQKLDTYKANGLRDLGSEMRQAVQSYTNQLGVAGAGDSSAVGLANYGLTQQNNRAVNDLNTGADQQQSGLNLQRTDLEQNYQQNQKMLDDWKNQQIQNIVNNYATQIQQIQSQIGSAQSQRAIDLAYIGKGQAANQALSQLSALESSYGANNSQLQNAYGQLQAPNADISQYSGQYAISPLTGEQIAADSLANNQATSTYTPTAIRLKTSTSS